MNTATESIMGTMQHHVNRNLLMYAAGQAIFCPACQAIMDCKSTVVATVHRQVGSDPEECVQSWTMCSKCWAKRRPTVVDSFTRVAGRHPELNARLEIVTWKVMETIKGPSTPPPAVTEDPRQTTML